jgi:hypothetical protein
MSIVSVVAALPFLLIGLHLLRVARASGAVPDRLLSAFFLLIAAGVVPRMTAVDMATSGAGVSEASMWLNAVAHLTIGSGLVCLVAFARKVFRPKAGWAKGLVVAVALGLLALAGVSLTSVEASTGSSPAAIAFNGIGAISLMWTFVECVSYYQQLRKRRALGMTDPVVANRFLLWSLWTGAISIQAAMMAVLRAGLWWSGAGEVIAEGGDPGGNWLAIIDSTKAMLIVVAPTAVISVYLSFSPPARYRSWLRSRQPQTEPL